MKVVEKTQLVHAVKKNAMLWLFFYVVSILSIFRVEYRFHNLAHSDDALLVHWDWIVLLPTACIWLYTEYSPRKRLLAVLSGLLFCGAGPVLFAGALFRNFSQFAAESEANHILILLVISTLFFGLYIRAKISMIIELD